MTRTPDKRKAYIPAVGNGIIRPGRLPIAGRARTGDPMSLHGRTLCHGTARRALVLLGVLAVVVVLAGCASTITGRAVPAGAAGTASVPAAPASGAHRFASAAELFAASMARERADRTAVVTLRGTITGRAPATVTGDGAVRFDGPGLSMRFHETVSLAGQPLLEVAMVLLPGVAYLKGPGSGSAGKPWEKITAGGTDPLSQQLGPLLSTLQQSGSPGDTLSRFGDAVRITAATDDTVDGTPAVRYQLRVDVAKAAAAAQDPEVRKALQGLAEAGSTGYDAAVWLDQQDRTLKYEQVQPLPDGASSDTVATVSGWGQPVDISPPPPEQVSER